MPEDKACFAFTNSCDRTIFQILIMFRKISFLILQFIVVTIPASLILYYALNSGLLPDNDYWNSITDILTPQGGFSGNISDWVKRNNEHYVLLPKLVYAANIVITGGSNVGLSLFTWFMAVLQLLILYQLIPVKSRQYPVLFVALLLAVSIFIFSPRHAHNWILGMSGTAWISANCFSLGAILSLQYYANTTKLSYYLTTFVLSLCALATYSTSLALFPTLVIAVVLLKLQRRDQALMVALSITIVSLYLLNYSTPTHHPDIQTSLSVLAAYFVAFIGALFNIKLKAALFSGALGLISSLLMSAYIYRKKTFWPAIIPWLCIQLYVCGNAAMAALARSGFGVEQALASRYRALPALFWLAWIMIASVVCLQQKLYYRKLFFIVLLSVSSVIVFNTYRIGLLSDKILLERAELKLFALASIYSHAYDMDLIHKSFFPAITELQMERITSLLEVSQHIPFNGIFNECPKIGASITKALTVDKKKFFGYFDQMRRRNGRVIEVKGWTYSDGAQPICLVVTNQDNIVRGIAINRPDVAKVIPRVLSDGVGWQGYGNVHNHDKTIKVFMLTSTGLWVQLNGRHQIDV